MSWNAVRQIVEERMKAAWPHPDVPVVFEEQKHHLTCETWVRCTIRFEESENAAMGQLVRENGLVIVQIFAPKGKGTGRVLALADDARKVFQNSTFGKLTFYAGSLVQVGQRDLYLQNNVQIPFFYQ